MKRILLVISTSIVVAITFVSLKYATFGFLMPKANFGMRAICKQNDIKDLYLGSSMFRQGIDSREMGDSTYLLSYSSNRPYLEAMQLKYLLEHGAKFKRLIVDMYPYSISRKVNLADVKMLMDGDLKFTIDLFTAMYKNGSSVSRLFEMLFLENNELFLTLPVSYKYMNDRYDRGSNTSKRHGVTKEELANKQPHEVENEELNPYQAEGLEDIIRICKEHSIDLVFLETPKYKTINEDRVYEKLMKQFSAFLSERKVKMILYKKTGDKIKGIVDDSLISTYDFDDGEALFYTDLYHISYEGRQDLSKRVINLLQ